MRRVISIILTVFLFVSCTFFSETDENSTIMVSLPGANDRSVYTKEDVLAYKIQLLMSDGTSVSSQEGLSGETVSFNDVDEGFYKVVMNAYSSENLIVARGESEIFKVNGGENTSVSVSMSPLEYFTVSFDVNGGEGVMSSVRISAGENGKLPKCTFTNPDSAFSFAGWALSDSSEMVYADEAVVSIENDLVLYAVWNDTSRIRVADVDELKNALQSGKTSIILSDNIYIDENLLIEGTSDSRILIDGDSSYHIISSSGNLTLSYIDFENGFGGTSGGGMILKTGGSLSVSDCTFRNCRNNGRHGGDGNGGTIFASNTSVSISNTSFYNDNDTPQAESGGLVYIGSGCSDVSISFCLFSGGYASHGGALNLRVDSLVSNCGFSTNRADYAGGAINAGDNAVVNVSDSTFSDNVCDSWNGSDIYTCSATVNLMECDDVDRCDE